jgi:geranylgeranyl diphosphate synthase, type III
MIDNLLVHFPSLGLAYCEDILKQRTTSQDLKLYCIQYMRNETCSFAYTHAVLGRLDLQARKEIDRLGGNKVLTEILDGLKIESGDEVR